MSQLTKAEKELIEGPIPKLFRKFAIPGVISLLFMGLQSVIDAIFLGNFVGANALASVNIALPCNTLITAVAIVISMGCLTVVSIRLGEKNRDGASDAIASAYTFLLIFAAAMSTLIYIMAPQFVRLLGANDVLAGDSVTYLRSIVPFFPFIVSMFFGDSIRKATGNPLYAMSIMTMTVVLNIVLDALFVPVLGWGVAGAGYATGIAFTVGALCNLSPIVGRKGIVSYWRGRFSWRLLGRMFYNGSSEGLSELSAGIAMVLFNVTIIRLMGETGVAAFTAINYVLFIGITVFLGISDGIVPIISHNFGAGKWERIKKALGIGIRINAIIGLVIFLLLTIWGEQITALFFNSSEVAVMDIAHRGASLVAFAFLLVGFNILTASYFTALANAKLSIIVSLSRGLVFIIVGLLVYPRVFGIDGIWMTIPMAELITFFISLLLVRRSLRSARNNPKFK